MSRTTYAAEWGSDTITISADWAQASCPVDGDEHGRQVADFRHSPAAAMRAALEDCARAEGSDPEDRDTAEAIDAAVEGMEEVRTSRVVSDGNAREQFDDWADVLGCVGEWYENYEWAEQAEALNGTDRSIDTDGVPEGDLATLHDRIRQAEERIAAALGAEAFAGHGNYYVSATSEAGLALTVEEAD